MATLRDRKLPTIERGWRKVQAFGFSPYTVTRRVTTWSGGESGSGTREVSDVTLTPNPQVEERAGGTELFLFGIVPSHASGGYSPNDLRPPLTTAQDLVYVVTGPNGAYAYVVKDLDTSDPVEYKMVLAGLERGTPY